MQIGKISQIKSGYFSQQIKDTGIAYLQSKQFDETGNLIFAPDTFLTPDNKCTAHLLKDGDIIFSAKGGKNFAWCYRDAFGAAIASSSFFVITPIGNIVIPEFICTIINQPKSQAYFQHLGLGSNIQSVRKNELEDFVIPLLPYHIQQKIIAIAELHKQDIKLTMQLLHEKNELYKTVIDKIANTKN